MDGVGDKTMHKLVKAIGEEYFPEWIKKKGLDKNGKN